MKVWTNKNFSGHWPVGTAAVVVAGNSVDAAHLLSVELKGQGLPQSVLAEDMKELPLESGVVRILNDGDY